MIKMGLKVEAACLFEPDLNSFRLMVENLSLLETPTYLWPCALGDANGTARFQPDNELGVSSKISTEGDTTVTTVKLDSIARNFNPNFMKLDVEGFELSVLKGAKDAILRFRPNLAVCLCHKAEDLWEIPLWLVDNFPDSTYKYYLRQHGHGFDSHCLYAVREAQRP
jgi:FkbM family methyltransferase